jgi:hypothetical protein
MSGSDAMHGEMPGFTFPGRPDVDHDEPLLDMIFDRRPLPPSAPPEMHDLARMLAVAAGPVERDELAGEAAALAAFSHSASPAGIASPVPGPARRRWWFRRSAGHARGRVRVAVAVTVMAALGGTAAYAGVLPDPLQRVAHAAVGAPAPAAASPVRPRPHPSRHPHPSPVPQRAPEPARAAHVAATPSPSSGATGRNWRWQRVHKPGCPYPRPGYPSWVSSCPAGAATVGASAQKITPGGSLTGPLQPPHGGTVPGA